MVKGWDFNCGWTIPSTWSIAGLFFFFLDQNKTSWIAAPERRCFPLTYGCGLGAEESNGERSRVRLHTTVGCSHGDERRKKDSKRSTTHAYVKTPITSTLQIRAQMHRHKRASLAWKLPVKCQIQPLARIKLPPLTFFFLFTFYVFYFSFLSFPSSVSLPSAVFSVSTLLMLVEGLRANAVNVSGFKALQMSACFIYLSISLFFFPKKR